MEKISFWLLTLSPTLGSFSVGSLRRSHSVIAFSYEHVHILVTRNEAHSECIFYEFAAPLPSWHVAFHAETRSTCISCGFAAPLPS